nr:unnamed protein product [Callosobruchus analis]
MQPASLLLLLFTLSNAQRMKTSVEIPGDLTIALLVKTCHNSSVDLIPYHTNSLVSSAMWVVERLNYLEHTTPLTLGLKVYEICEEIDFFKSIFDLYQAENDYLLTVVSEDTLSEKMLNFCEVLDVRSSSIARCSKLLVKTTVEFLNAMGWVENVTVFGPDEFIMEEFSSYAVKQSVCVMDLIIYGNACPNVMNTSTPIVYFGNKCNIEHFSTHQENNTNEMLKIIFVPLDGSVPAGKSFCNTVYSKSAIQYIKQSL